MIRTLLLLCLTTSLAVAQPIVKGSRAAKIDSLLTNITPFGFSGVLAVVKNDELILKKAYGLADRTNGKTLAESTPFIIGSLSKQFTAAAILKLESEGKLRVSDTLGRFFRSAPPSSSGLTLHQLMTHSAGLPYFSKSSLMEQKPRDQKMEELLQLSPEFSPGTRYSYSNPGYTILAGVIEAASGSTFEYYLRTRFFIPLGMTETGFVAESDRWKLSGPHSYSDGNDEGALSDWHEGAEFAGAGNIVSTVGDLYKWETALRTGKILPDSSRTKLFTAHIPTQGKNGYGYGWNVNKTIRNTTVIAHAGDLGGYNSDLRRYADEGYTLIFLSNAREGGRGYRDAAMNPASLILSGSDLPIPPSAIALPADLLADLAGSYAANGNEIRITTEENALVVAAAGQHAINLLLPNISDSVVLKFSIATDAIIQDLSKGEYGSLRTSLSPSFPFENSKASFAEMFRSQELGKLRGIQVTGSTILQPASGRTYFTVEFERGKRYYSYAWSGGKISGAKDEPSEGPTLKFIPISKTEFTNVDPFTGKHIDLKLYDRKLQVNGHELSKR